MNRKSLDMGNIIFGVAIIVVPALKSKSFSI